MDPRNPLRALIRAVASSRFPAECPRAQPRACGFASPLSRSKLPSTTNAATVHVTPFAARLFTAGGRPLEDRRASPMSTVARLRDDPDHGVNRPAGEKRPAGEHPDSLSGCFVQAASASATEGRSGRGGRRSKRVPSRPGPIEQPPADEKPDQHECDANDPFGFARHPRHASSFSADAARVRQFAGDHSVSARSILHAPRSRAQLGRQPRWWRHDRRGGGFPRIDRWAPNEPRA